MRSFFVLFLMTGCVAASDSDLPYLADNLDEMSMENAADIDKPTPKEEEEQKEPVDQPSTPQILMIERAPAHPLFLTWNEVKDDRVDGQIVAIRFVRFWRV